MQLRVMGGQGEQPRPVLRGDWRGGRVSRCVQRLPIPPCPSTHQSGPGKETGHPRGRQRLSTALQLRCRKLLPPGFKTEATGVVPRASCHPCWLTPTSHGPHPAFPLHPRAAAKSPTKHSQEGPVAGRCSSPETCLRGSPLVRASPGPGSYALSPQAPPCSSPHLGPFPLTQGIEDRHSHPSPYLGHSEWS